MRLLACIVLKFVTELWPLIDVRISFLSNIFRTNGQILTKLCIQIDVDKFQAIFSFAKLAVEL